MKYKTGHRSLSEFKSRVRNVVAGVLEMKCWCTYLNDTFEKSLMQSFVSSYFTVKLVQCLPGLGGREGLESHYTNRVNVRIQKKKIKKSSRLKSTFLLTDGVSVPCVIIVFCFCFLFSNSHYCFFSRSFGMRIQEILPKCGQTNVRGITVFWNLESCILIHLFEAKLVCASKYVVVWSCINEV